MSYGHKKVKQMSPTSTDRWKETAQSVCAIVVLAALFWFGRHGLAARGGRSDDAVRLFDFATMCDGRPDFDYCESDDEDEEIECAEVLRMPVCMDLKNSIGKLLDARNDLMKLAVDSDEQGILIAAGQYREAIKEVQAGFAKLKMRVDPDAFSCVSEDLLCSYETDQQWGLKMWELGHYAEEIGQ